MVLKLFSKKFIVFAVAALFIAAAMIPTAFAQASDCISTDVKGELNYTDNHLSGNPVTGFFVNIATNPECSDDVFVHVFGSNIAPETGDWLGSQSHVMTQPVTVPQDGVDHPFELSIPDAGYCWYQVDATRTSDVRIPPTYSGVDMIAYVFVKGSDTCGEVTPTPSATPSATPTDSPTPTPDNGGGSSSNSTSSSNEAPKTVESIQATMGTSAMANTGIAVPTLMNFSLAAGMLIAALGALSYASDKKTILS